MFSKETIELANANVESPAPFNEGYRKMCEELLLDKGNFYERDLYCLSNFSAFKMKWKGYTFDTSEHVYHWEKFNRDNHKCEYIQEYIRLKTVSAHEAFKVAETQKEHRRGDWDEMTINGRPVKVNIMKNILLTKLDQHKYVAHKLKEAYTKGIVLTERSWRDSFWGCGEDGKGEDWMGLLWNEIAKETCG